VDKTKILPKFLFYILKDKKEFIQSLATGVTIKEVRPPKLKDLFSFPLPPIEIQKEIVAELDNYQKIIDGARQIIDNYKPVIEVNKEWEITNFSNDKIVKIIDGDRGKNYPPKSEFKKSGHCVFLNTKNVTQEGFVFDKIDFILKERDKKLRKGKLQKEDVVLTTRGTVGNSALNCESVEYDHIRINSGMVILRPNTRKIMPVYLWNVVKSKDVQDQFRKIKSGSAQPQLPIRSLVKVEFSLPSLKIQKKIVTRIEEEQKIIEANKELIKLFEQKIKDKTSEVWGE
jgi:restriction endonuclease S subunit